MAVNCSNTLEVTGATTTAVNGIYERVLGIDPILKYTKQGDPSIVLELAGPPPHLPFLPYVWRFRAEPYNGTNIYYSYSQSNSINCAEDYAANLWTAGSLGTGTGPTITGVSEIGVSFDPFAPWATQTETGRTRFLRLKVLGYV